jgi:hypothetical protein
MSVVLDCINKLELWNVAICMHIYTVYARMYTRVLIFGVCILLRVSDQGDGGFYSVYATLIS